MASRLMILSLWRRSTARYAGGRTIDSRHAGSSISPAYVYVNFRKPSQADDSEMTDDYVTIRYQGDEAVGLTILSASQR